MWCCDIGPHGLKLGVKLIQAQHNIRAIKALRVWERFRGPYNYFGVAMLRVDTATSGFARSTRAPCQLLAPSTPVSI